MDSISGPELSPKVHGLGGTVKGSGHKPTAERPLTALCAGLLAFALSGCSADPKEVSGALGLAAKAAGEGDTESLFWVVDERARHALDGIVKARTRAATMIRESYPQSEQDAALTALGDGVDLASGRALFQARCDRACLDWFTQTLRAPESVRKEGPLTHVTTVSGREVALFQDDSGRYGVVWHTTELDRERARAFAELELIEQNAQEYARKRALHK